MMPLMDNQTNNENLTQKDTDTSSLPTGRPTWAEVDLQALRDNYRALCSLYPPSSTESTQNASIVHPRIIPVIKADAYGHGAVEAARTLADAGVKMFSVGTVEEGAVLRQSGISQDILVMATTWQGLEYLEKAVMAGFKDEERYKQLVDHPDLLEREKVKAFLKDKNLLPSE